MAATRLRFEAVTEERLWPVALTLMEQFQLSAISPAEHASNKRMLASFCISGETAEVKCLN